MSGRIFGATGSRLALSAALAATAWQAGGAAMAQAITTNDPQNVEPEAAAPSTDRVVVTGSFISGTPEDAAVPVQVVTLEDLENLGSPTGMDLVKTFTTVGGVVAGETNRFNSYPQNYATVNLRGLGASRSLVLFNGRRFAEQFGYATGRAVNINQIPMAAIGRVETVTDGGATTYGADAVGGVVNYVTRTDFDGFQASVDYRYVEDADGDYGLDLLWGKDFDNGNILLSASYDHRSALDARDRDFAASHYLLNPTFLSGSVFSSAGNPGSYYFSTSQLPGGAITNLVGGANNYLGDYQMGINGTVRDPACTDLGGFAGWSVTASAACFFSLDTTFDHLAEESDTINVYGEVNVDFSDSLRFHGEVNYYDAFTNATTHPSDAIVTGRGFSIYSTSGANPAVADMLARIQSSDGTTAYTSAQIAAITDTGRAFLTNWRPFAQGGHPLQGETGYHRIAQKQARVSGEFSGDLPEFWGTSLEWSTALTYTRTLYNQKATDIRSDRMVAALNGLGGANCVGATPGLNGCQWFNPFSSAVASNMYTGDQNSTTFVGTGSYAGYMPGQGLQNDPDLIRWMTVPIWNQRTYDQLAIDFVVNGEIGIELPGGPIEAAAGGQYRFNRSDDQLDPLSDLDQTPCAEGPGFGLSSCPTAPGSLMFGRQSTVLGPSREITRRYPVLAGFYEINFPILDRWSVSTSGRWEKFFSDLSDTDQDTFVPQIATKFEITDWLSLRGTAGKTFSYVSPPANDGPTVGTVSGTTAISGVNGSFGIGTAAAPFVSANYDNTGVRPEDGTSYNVGALFKFLEGDLTTRIDYYNIELDDYVRTVTTGALIQALVEPGQINGATNLINCSSPLLSDNDPVKGGRPTVELNGACVQGVSTLANALATSGNMGRVNFFGGTRQTNGGTFNTSGIDFATRYRLRDVLGGDMTFSLEGTRVLEFGLEDFMIGGAKIANGFDGVGFMNSSANNSGLGPVSEWRANFGVNYTYDIHNLNLAVRYASGLTNEDAPQFTEYPANNPNIGDVNGYVTCPGSDQNPILSGAGDIPAGAGSGMYGSDAGGLTGYCSQLNYRNFAGMSLDDMFTVDLVYRLSLPSDLTVAMSVFNLLDQEPEFSREKFSYNTSLGSPLGRSLKLEIKKLF